MIRIILAALLLSCLAGGPALARADDEPSVELSSSHYLIPGFSEHLLSYGRLIYSDLLSARNAAATHGTMELRLSLADAGGHLLQLSTPPALADLRRKMVVVGQALSGRSSTAPSTAWQHLIDAIRKLPLHPADRAARARLLKTAEHGLDQSSRGAFGASRKSLDELIAEIEITNHVFPISDVRTSVDAAIAAASAFSPHWVAAQAAIDRALAQTHWLTTAQASYLIRAFDALVAAYVEFPETVSGARQSLNQASAWLSHTHTATDLRHDIRQNAADQTLSLEQIGDLQSRLARIIRQADNQAAGG